MALNSTVNVYGYKPPKNIIDSGLAKTKKVYGFLFPTGKSTRNGFFPKSSGIELVKNNLIQLLRTERGERVMLPDFGCNLKKFLFEPLDEEVFRAIKNEILTTISKYAVGVEVVKLAVNQLDSFGAEGLQAIQISLTVKLSEIDDVVFDVTTRIE